MIHEGKVLISKDGSKVLIVGKNKQTTIWPEFVNWSPQDFHESDLIHAGLISVESVVHELRELRSKVDVFEKEHVRRCETVKNALVYGDNKIGPVPVPVPMPTVIKRHNASNDNF